MSDTSMFNFLLEEAHDNNLDLNTLVEFGKEASNALVGVGKVPLNETIVKTASSHNLNDDQIKLVCQEANKSAHRDLFKTAEDKYVVFDVADFHEVKDLVDGVTEKTASFNGIDMDYVSSPGEDKKYRDFSFQKTAGHDGLWDNTKVLDRRSIEKLAMQKQELEDQFLLKTAALQSKEKEFIKESKMILLNVPFSHREEGLGGLATFCKQAGLDNPRISDLVTKVANSLVNSGYLNKNASVDVTEAIKGADGADVNTSHSLYKTVETIKKYDKERADLKRGASNLVQTTGPNE